MNAFSDLVVQAIDGQTSANKLVHQIRSGIVEPDLLHDRLQAEFVLGKPERVRSFCRVLQKALEREGHQR